MTIMKSWQDGPYSGFIVITKVQTTSKRAAGKAADQTTGNILTVFYLRVISLQLEFYYSVFVYK